MPFGGGIIPSDPDEFESAAQQLPVPQAVHTGAVFGGAFTDFARQAGQLGKGIVSDFTQPQILDPNTGFTHTPQVDSETLNQRYAVPGYLRFNEARTEDDAAFMSSMAQERQFNAYVFSRTNPQPLTDFGVGLAGSLLDPVGLGVMVGTGGLGDLALGGVDAARAALAGRAAVGAAPAISTLGRVANAAGVGARYLAEGALDNAPYVAINAGLSNLYGNDYSGGDALRDIAAGAILHTGLHLVFRGGRAMFGPRGDPDAPAIPGLEGAHPVPDGFEPNPAPAGGVPDAVEQLPEVARRGAFVKAITDMTDDRPVDVGQYVDRETSIDSLPALDERTAASAIPSLRPLDPDTAVTTRGTEVPVRYGLAEMGDLTTSHDDNLAVNPDYPPELQPRERDRLGAQARNFQLESELNPKLLMNDVGAGSGAPIVSPDGVVESGNGRTIALRRSAAKGGAAYQRYTAELKTRGYDTTGMDKPMLVRVRTEAMSGAGRATLAREMNADVTERMSTPEQAIADARSIDDASLSHIDGTPAGNRAFARSFLAKVAGDQANTLVSPDGQLSKAGQDRIDAALTAKAYGDPRLVEAIFEAADGNIKAIGAALREAAPIWAAMRSAMARGNVPAELDVTAALRSAVDLVRHARDNKLNLSRYIAELLDQQEMFSGGAVSAETEAMLRLMFRDEHFTRPLAAAKLADALKDYARSAQAFTPGPDLFGKTPDASDARQILASLAQRFAAGDDGQPDLLRPPGRTDEPSGGERGAAEPPVIDLRQPEPAGERTDGRVSDDGKPGPGGEGGGAQPAGVEEKTPREPGTGARGASFIQADPELKALAEDTDRLAAGAGLELEAKPNEDPDTLADAVHAAAVCLAEEAE